MQLNQCTFLFRSIEEALSSSNLSKTVDLDDLRERLANLPRNRDWTGIDGIKWRRPIIPVRKDPLIENSTVSIESQSPFSTESESATRGGIISSWKNCLIIKRDLVLDKNLIGFERMSLAYEDWERTIRSAQNFPESEAPSLENFKNYYLDGDRNIDGIIWETADSRNFVEENRGKEIAITDNTTYPTETETKAVQNVSPDANGRNLPIRKEELKNMFRNESANTKIKNNLQSIHVSKSSVNATEEKSLSRKRKFLNDKEIMESQTGKEARFSVVTV